MKTILSFLLPALLFAGSMSAQIVHNERLLSFEETNLSADLSVSRGSIATSTRHYKDGQRSLRWTFRPGSVLSLQHDLRFEPKDPMGADTYLSAFIVWVYNERAQNRTIEFRFLKDGKQCASFPFGIDFTGWRAAWVCYERDMQGTPEEGMNELRIVAPDVRGELFIDHLVTGVKVDARQQTADVQVPFVNKGTTNHWLVVYEHSLWKPELPLTPVSEWHRAEMHRVEKRFEEMLYTPSALSEKEMQSIRRHYAGYGISYNKGVVTGLPIFMVRQAEAYERMLPDWDKNMFVKLGMEMNDYFNLMRRIAVAYRDANHALARSENVSPARKADTEAGDMRKWKAELRDKFLAMYDHITDQGVAYGSCWGNIHHYGYSMRGLYVAYFLMKDVLQAAGKLDEAERTMRWYAIANEVYPRPKRDGIDMDSFNTQTQGRIASILMMHDTPEKLQYLRSFSRWIDYGCRPASGLAGSFKKDGSAFHHRNHYPAYAVGGLEGAVNMIYLLSGTDFKVSPLAHATVKKALLAMRFYCNVRQWPLSMSGRHPNGKGQLIPLQYATLALAGTPDASERIDSELAAAYLRLMEHTPVPDKQAPDYLPQASSIREQELERSFKEAGFCAESHPQGNLALGYACASVHRRAHWAAVVRGHSRYLWAAEHYLDANFYGRYLAHGSMQILTGDSGETVTFGTSGWQEAGFDWNRIPGATAIRLPFDSLRARVLNVDTFSGMEEMLFSDEAFAGGLSHEGTHGNFGMKLHEHDKYNGSHRARKSYHFLGDVIVCLGSGIRNANETHPTETTLFQLAASSPRTKAYWQKYEQNGQTFLDPNGVGYYLPENSLKAAKFEKNFPQVTVGERSTAPTSGDWVSLVLQHGTAPKGAAYEYAVLPCTDRQTLQAFALHPSYRVWRHDDTAHVVHSLADTLTSYVLFDAPDSLPGAGVLERADTACLVMTRLSGDDLQLTLSQPDLAFYRGGSDDVYDERGRRVERSIYSRPWIDNESGEIPVTVTLRGKWEVATPPVSSVSAGYDGQSLASRSLGKEVFPPVAYELRRTDAGRTTLRIRCKDAASYGMTLRRVR